MALRGLTRRRWILGWWLACCPSGEDRDATTTRHAPVASSPSPSLQFVAHSIQICPVAQLGREALKRRPRVVLPAVEAAVYERGGPPWRGPVGTRVRPGRRGKPRPDYGLPNLTLYRLNIVSVRCSVFKAHHGESSDVL